MLTAVRRVIGAWLTRPGPLLIPLVMMFVT